MDDGDAAHPAGGLVGRSEESALLASFLERAARSGAALLLTGEPGVGRTALLDLAARAAAASGTRVLSSAGAEVEAEVPFAGLHQLLVPVLDEWAALSPLHRGALARSLGYQAGPPADRLVVSTAVLTLLRRVADGGPVLLVVDDLQWLDRVSVAVLGFVARRLSGARVGLLAAARTEDDGSLPPAGLPEHEVRPLDDGAAAELVGSRHPAMAERVRRRIVAAARGNPVALLELPDQLSGRQRAALEALPPVLPLGRRLRTRFAGRVADLPPATRRLLLLAALEGTGDLAVLGAASPGEDWLDVLAPAEEAGLVHVDADTQRVSLRHPLTGSAAVELATSGDRRRAHLALADVLADQPDRRAWHLAEAAVGSDGQAADLLDEAAHRALRRGDGGRAVAALLRAADLSPSGAARARRLSRAAYLGARVLGDLRSVPSLLLQARRADPDGGDALPAALAAAVHLFLGPGDADSAHAGLVRAIGSALRGPVGSGDLDEALSDLLDVCCAAGRADRWPPLESATARLGPRLGPVLAVARSTRGAPARTTAADLSRLDGVLAGIDAEADPARIVRIGAAALAVDRLEECRPALWRVVWDGREGGAAGSAVGALVLLSRDAFDAGRWGEARRTAEEAVERGEALDHRLPAATATGVLALLAAAEGDGATARALAARVSSWAGPRGLHGLEHAAARARALAALAAGDVEEAYRQGTAVGPPGLLPPHLPVALEVPLDLVEAAVRTGRRAEAAAHAAALRELEVVRLRPRPALLAAGCAALAAPDDRAAACFEEAMAVPGADRHPFEHARVRLAYGEHLRRVRATGAARLHLAASLEAFTRLGARPWAARAEHELRATGVSRSPAGRAAPVELTPQEHEISLLAASGLTNKQIGAQLYLSPRTVSAHLYRVFPKLGISSRAALRDALTRVPQEAGNREPA
ncbi:regulatory protein, luxR family [Geodermatophilus saharensis]|uniref:Regulatory protein, luxR family n=1 Tax=Geodermatophilus saharensis TaxID=1137994 RepID=A0A239CZY7_9ACTN|nr:LuxR family transcriptional regulator [Geodermatophilus saharensis]SNS25104.1 regulatory protein, luxR family [Geodermatophilus saharensis]